MHYIRNGDGVEELYDVTRDLWERRDLAASREGLEMLDDSRAALERILRRRTTS